MTSILSLTIFTSPKALLSGHCWNLCSENWLQMGLWLAHHAETCCHIWAAPALLTNERLFPVSMCALEFLTLVFIFASSSYHSLWCLQLHTPTSCALLNLTTPFADALFDLLVCFQLFFSFKVTSFVKLFNAHLHLVLGPLYLIYVKYHFCLFLWMGNVFVRKLLCIL